MPLLPGKKNISHNVKEMEKAGHSKINRKYFFLVINFFFFSVFVEEIYHCKSSWQSVFLSILGKTRKEKMEHKKPMKKGK